MRLWMRLKRMGPRNEIWSLTMYYTMVASISAFVVHTLPIRP